MKRIEFLADVNPSDLTRFYESVSVHIIRIKEHSKDLGGYHFILEGTLENYLKLKSLNICNLKQIE